MSLATLICDGNARLNPRTVDAPVSQEDKTDEGDYILDVLTILKDDFIEYGCGGGYSTVTSHPIKWDAITTYIAAVAYIHNHYNHTILSSTKRAAHVLFA